MLRKIFTAIKEWFPDVIVTIVVLIILIFVVRFVTRTYRHTKDLYEKVMNFNSNTISLPDSSQVYIIQPQGEQEVIIIGDPNKITIKPKKK